ncbi:NeuD/PglB/VioB family sugar acetyltransferase [Paenibacillus sp. y28]|uniref:NeuD/PglB/VioB family sugar acetyltransferase n=1 Tax=Paenibacillus sp. y28 TaxID=3129110 RepID=UPI0030158FC7
MNIAIFGASGLAVEVADICERLGYQDVVLLEKEGVQNRPQEYPVLAESSAEALSAAGFKFIIAVGRPDVRKRIYEAFPELAYVNIVHPGAALGSRQKAGLLGRKGNIVFAGAQMTTGIRCGSFGIYNQNCTVAHDCIIENYVTIGPGASISGNVHLKEGAYVGTGAVILQGRSLENKLEIGRCATIGAGAVVTKPVPDNQTVKGVPAR